MNLAKNAVVIFVIFLFLNIIVDAQSTTHITYLSYLDDGLGFYKVLDLTTHRPSPYDNRTLIINQGDTITWMNDADDPHMVLTVVSDQNLFENKILNVNQRSSYTFNQIGTFTFYLKEYENRKQTIIVDSIEDTTPTPTSTPTSPPTSTPTITSTPIATTPAVTPTPTDTGIIPNVGGTNPPPQNPSTTQFLSIIVSAISIFITYQIGRNSKGHKKSGYKKKGKIKPNNFEYKNENKSLVDDSDSNIRFGQKLSGALCYSLGFITGIIFLIFANKENKFVRFHAVQSVTTFFFLFIILFVLLENQKIGDIFGPFVLLLEFFIWLALMVSAFRGKIYKLPIIGNFADNRS